MPGFSYRPGVATVKAVRLLICTTLLLLMQACGQTGPLTYPEAAPAPGAEQNADAGSPPAAP